MRELPHTMEVGAAAHTATPASTAHPDLQHDFAMPGMSTTRVIDRFGVEVVRERAAFVRLASEWNSLVEATSDQVFYRHEFLRIWIDNFAPGAELRILTLRDGDGRLTAALPLIAERASVYGVPVRQLSATANPHSCRFDVIAREPAAAAAAFVAWLRADRAWDVLRLTDVPAGGAGWALIAEARARGLPTGAWESVRSPYVPLPATWDAFQSRLHAKFRANCRRRRRKLEEKGKVALDRVEGGLALDAALEEGFALEQSGWKGQRGTAIAQDPATRGFYTELARDAADAGRLSLFFLRLGGRAVAFQYGLTHGPRYLLLKPGYDESLSDCSPGQLLTEDVMADCVARGLSEFEFLGPDMPWKRDWTDAVRPHAFLYVFADSALGRALRAAKFRWAPAVKRRLARFTR
jgi:CelD/BcsL family acetyltransferase involved in cellulose biosynthesis